METRITRLRMERSAKLVAVRAVRYVLEKKLPCRRYPVRDRTSIVLVGLFIIMPPFVFTYNSCVVCVKCV